MHAGIKRMISRNFFIDVPDWVSSGSLEEWHEKYNEETSGKIRIKPSSGFEVRELKHFEAGEFSKLMRGNILKYEYVSKLHKLLAVVRRSPAYYRRLLLSDKHILLRAGKESGRMAGGLEASIKKNSFDEKYVHIRWLLIMPEYRDRNIGIMLLNELERLLIGQGIFYTISAVHFANQSCIRVHEKFGARKFSISGEYFYFAKRLCGSD